MKTKFLLTLLAAATTTTSFAATESYLFLDRTKSLSPTEAIGGNNTFSLVRDGKMMYLASTSGNAWDYKFATPETIFATEYISIAFGAANSTVNTADYLLPIYETDLATQQTVSYNFSKGLSYLNSTANGSGTFGLSIANHGTGQDGEGLAEWDIQPVEAGGYSFKNATTGKYLVGTAANSTDVVAWNLYNVAWKDYESSWSYLDKEGSYSLKSGIAKENYRSSAGPIGEVISNTITGLPNGTYTVLLQAAVSRAWNSTHPVGDNLSVAYANDNTAPLTVEARTSITTLTPVAIDVTVTDGTLKVGIRNIATSANWYVLRVAALAYNKTITEVINNTLEDVEKANLSESGMNASVYANFSAAVSAAKNLDGKSDAEQGAIYATLKAAFDAAKTSAAEYTSIENYAGEIAANVEKLDEAGKAYYKAKSAEVSAKLSNREYETYAAYESELKPIYVQAVKAQTSLNSDWTGVIENAHFKSTDISAWNTNGLGTPSVDANQHVCEFYNKSFNLSQTIGGMKKGTYQISLQAFQRLGAAGTAADLMAAYKADNWTSVAELYTTAQTSNVKNICEYAQKERVYYVEGYWGNDTQFAYDGDTLYIPNSMTGTRKWFDRTDDNGVAFYTTTAKAVVTEDGGDLTFGFRGDVTGDAKWLIFDNFTLTYISEDVMVDENESKTLLEKVPSTPYDAELKAQVDEIAANLKGDLTNGTYYAALQALMGDATTSATTYATAKENIELMGEFVKTTNVYTEEAYEAYYTTPKANFEEKYAAGTLTTEEASAIENPYAKLGHKAANNVDDLLLSSWGVKDYESSLYINTWSDEGDNDGSEFTVPFYEYWTGNANSLSEKTWTATLSGLNAGQLYEVSALSRVRIKNNATAAPYGISLQVGEGAVVNVCDAEQIGESQLYLQKSVAVGAADEDGTLTISYIVAGDNNISWLAFKDVNYAVFTAPEAETRASAENTFGTICLPYAFMSAGSTLYEIDEVGESKVTLKEVETAEAGVAYIYQATADEQIFSYKEGALSCKPIAGILTGIFEPSKATAGTYVLQTQNNEQAFYLVAEGQEPTIGAYRAYLTVPSADNASALRISFGGETATGIEAVEAFMGGKAEIYDLNGRKLNKLQKGVNIVNGTKVIVK